MRTICTFYKNSNTGQLIKEQRFEDTPFVCPIFQYDCNGKPIEPVDLVGFVQISERKFNRECRKSKHTQP